MRSRQPVDRKQSLHPRRREVRIVQHTRFIRQAEQLGEMDERPRALLPTYHDEVILQPVEPGQEHEPGLVEARRRLEDVAAERNRGLEDTVETLQVACGQTCETGRGGRCDAVEN